MVLIILVKLLWGTHRWQKSCWLRVVHCRWSHSTQMSSDGCVWWWFPFAEMKKKKKTCLTVKQPSTVMWEKPQYSLLKFEQKINFFFHNWYHSVIFKYVDQISSNCSGVYHEILSGPFDTWHKYGDHHCDSKDKTITTSWSSHLFIIICLLWDVEIHI